MNDAFYSLGPKRNYLSSILPKDNLIMTQSTSSTDWIGMLQNKIKLMASKNLRLTVNYKQMADIAKTELECQLHHI